ncbi:MAG: protein kinase [Kofleriaceae bacterium]
MIAEGAVIGNYRILSRLGTGGMGAVFLAEHPLIGKRVALKVIHRELSGNKEVVQRFWQEARAVNKIGNEHIVEIHDFGQSADGDHFYLMEYLEGRTLASLLGRSGRFEVIRALHVTAQLASALAAAHATGIIHRDLKPDNVMLVHRHGDPDFVKLLDFGLAKMFAAGGATPLTAAGVVLGTPQYMSPEACESKKEVDHRTDIYAVGVLLFQMVTGQLPFDGQSMGEVMIKQVTQPPPAPRALNPAIPPAVEQIILRCLAKAADARFPTMTALREALLDPDAYLASSPPVMPAYSVTRPGPAVGAPTPPRADSAPPVAPARGMPLPAPAATVIGSVAAAGWGPDRGGLPAAAGRSSTAVPAQNHTMLIATPPGYVSRPRRGPLVPVLLGLLAVVVTAAVVVAVRGGRGAPAGLLAGIEPPPADARAPVAAAARRCTAAGGAGPPDRRGAVGGRAAPRRRPGRRRDRRSRRRGARRRADAPDRAARRQPRAHVPRARLRVGHPPGRHQRRRRHQGRAATGPGRRARRPSRRHASAAARRARPHGARVARPRLPAPGAGGCCGRAARHPRRCRARRPRRGAGRARGGGGGAPRADRGDRRGPSRGRRRAARGRGRAAAVRRAMETEARQEVLSARASADDELGARAAAIDEHEARLGVREAELAAHSSELDQREEAQAEAHKATQALRDRAAGLERDARQRTEAARTQLQGKAGVSAERLIEEMQARWLEDVRQEGAARVRAVDGSAADPQLDREAKRVLEIVACRIQGHYLTERNASNLRLGSELVEAVLDGGGALHGAIERASNVTLLVNDARDAIRLDGLDSTGKEIARRAFGKLQRKPEALLEAKAQPDVWATKIREQIEQEIRGLGRKAFQVLGVAKACPEITELVGALNFRTSYTQNQWFHAVESAFLAGMMAAELGLDVKLARRATVMHDIGKALTHKIEGSHAVIGAEIARRVGEPELVANAIGSHHADEPPNSIYAYLLAAADAMSGARPGARREQTEGFSTKIEDLERIGRSHRGVDFAHAVQGGRELRVYVRNDQVDDLAVVELSADIAAQVSEELTFPGQIKVTVIRAYEAVSTAN